MTFSSAPPKLNSSSTGKNQIANAAAAFQRPWRGSLAFTVPKNVQTRYEIAKNHEIGAGTVSNIQVMSLVFGPSKTIQSKE